ncbi:MAG: hypothetical protein ACJ70M_02065 [Nitrososphaera sp.]
MATASMTLYLWVEFRVDIIECGKTGRNLFMAESATPIQLTSKRNSSSRNYGIATN